MRGKSMLASHVSIENQVSVNNLMSAFEGESNANASYTEFARRADADGLHGAASLFRAAARAEQIHANNHARSIRHLGGELTAASHHVEVKSTLENLKAALSGEQHEIDSMYPEFLKQAEACNNTTAIRTLDWALEAEKSHARLYSEAIALVEGGETDSWVGTTRDFYVCAVCGYTSETREGER
jgi:rubrerythrin